ncbi:ChuX/HutX family heme-like substrate-binding protein [Rhodobacter sp. NSM]|uniref:ChuX/HutX family heme-like substrate-binding protein n=1 Tax=Rhodobacter sp. NSM TaxID=3457501 RepID=UPI003FCF78E1
MTPAEIRQARRANTRARARDFAESHGIAEAALVAAFVGPSVIALDAAPARLLGLAAGLGEALALTRNASAVQERQGRYGPLSSAGPLSMLTGDGIEFILDPCHWVHAFAVIDETAKGTKRSIQIFDAVGEAVHKLHLTPESDVAGFDRLVTELRLHDQPDDLPLLAPAMRGTPEGAADPVVIARLWDEAPSARSFAQRLASEGIPIVAALRAVGAARAKPLLPVAMTELLERASAGQVPLEIRAGNAGCLQIYRGPVDRILPAGYWINVMDPGYNLHLRTDHLASVHLTDRRPQGSLAVEAHDAAGDLILEVTGGPGWQEIVESLSAAAVS